VPNIANRGAAASAVLLVEGDSSSVRYQGLAEALAEADTQIRLFGKPEVRGERRMGVALALGKEIDEALARAKAAVERIQVSFSD
jgi:phosphoribosylglycinamide formyltransferase 2